MKKTSALGIIFILTASACAPVASSVPKMVATSPRTVDSIDEKRNGPEFLPASEVRVISADQYDQFEKQLDTDYKVEKFYDRDGKVSELRNTRGISKLSLPSMKRMEALVILVMKPNTKASEMSSAKPLKLRWDRDTRDQYSFLVSNVDGSAEAWDSIKDDVDSVVIAYREAPTKK